MNIKDFSETNRVEQKQTQSKNSNVKDKFEQIKDTPEFKQVENEYGDFIKDFVDNYSNMSEYEWDGALTYALSSVANFCEWVNKDAGTSALEDLVNMFH